MPPPLTVTPIPLCPLSVIPTTTTILLPAFVVFGHTGSVTVDAVCSWPRRTSWLIVGAAPVPPPPGGVILYAVWSSAYAFAFGHDQPVAVGLRMLVRFRSARPRARVVPLAFSVAARFVRLPLADNVPALVPLAPTLTRLTSNSLACEVAAATLVLTLVFVNALL